MQEITCQYDDIAKSVQCTFLSSMGISHSTNGKTDYIEGKTRLTLIEFDCR